MRILRVRNGKSGGSIVGNGSEGKPQKPFINRADRITGSVLDAGCGTGDTALLFAGRDCQVSGIGFIKQAISRARQKAAERGVQATFLVKDALTLKDWTEPFDSVIDQRPVPRLLGRGPAALRRGAGNGAEAGRPSFLVVREAFS